jgi:shikimate dehydrogenase
MTISGHTRPYAVLGHPVGHTLSPAMHNAAFAALGLDAVYLALDVRPERLLDTLPVLRDAGFGGLNLTIPLKEIAFRGLNALDETAQLMGAVNTVRFAPEGMIGHNTDGAGFLKAVEEVFETAVAGKSVFVLGAGGAGRAVALACAGAGIRSLVLADVDAARAAKVASEVETQFFVQEVKAVVSAEDVRVSARAADLVVQATPVGMKPDDGSPLGPEAFREGQLAFDLVYQYPETPFMRAAAAGRALVANGLGMLLHQGARAFEIWTGRQPSASAMRRALEAEVYGRR